MDNQQPGFSLSHSIIAIAFIIFIIAIIFVIKEKKLVPVHKSTQDLAPLIKDADIMKNDLLEKEQAVSKAQSYPLTQTYAGATFSFSYPEGFQTRETSWGVHVSHSVPFTFVDDYCIFDDETVPETQHAFGDFGMNVSIVQKGIIDIVKENSFLAEQVLIQGSLVPSPGYFDAVTVGKYQGYSHAVGAEGCGVTTWYFVIDAATTLEISMPYNPYLTEYNDGPENKFSNIPGVIHPNDKKKIFEDIVNSFQIKGQVGGLDFSANNSGWKTYVSDAFGFSIQYPESQSENLIVNNETITNLNKPGCDELSPKTCDFPPDAFFVQIGNIRTNSTGATCEQSLQGVSKIPQGEILNSRISNGYTIHQYFMNYGQARDTNYTACIDNGDSSFQVRSFVINGNFDLARQIINSLMM